MTQGTAVAEDFGKPLKSTLGNDIVRLRGAQHKGRYVVLLEISHGARHASHVVLRIHFGWKATFLDPFLPLIRF